MTLSTGSTGTNRPQGKNVGKWEKLENVWENRRKCGNSLEFSVIKSGSTTHCVWRILRYAGVNRLNSWIIGFEVGLPVWLDSSLPYLNSTGTVSVLIKQVLRQVSAAMYTADNQAVGPKWISALMLPRILEVR